MIGHSHKITAISQTNNFATTARFVSASADGRICLWEIQDGRCIDSTTSIAIHRYIHPYTYKSSRHTRATLLFCIGDYSDIQVMDPQDLTVKFSISSRVEPDWISCYTLITRPEKEDQIIGMTLSGMMKVWTLAELEKKDLANSLYEDESKRLEIRHIRAVSYFVATRRMLLIVASSSWTVLDVDDMSTLVSYRIENNLRRFAAGYISNWDKVTIGYTDESISVFQLPVLALQKESSPTNGTNRPTANYFNEPNPFVVATVNGVQDNVKTCLNDTQYAFFTVDSSPGSSEKRKVTVIKSSRRDGSVLVWNQPSMDHQFMKSLPGLKNLPLKFNGTYRESLARIWQTLNESEKGSMPALNSEAVCCSLFVPSQGKLFLGRCDGIITMTYACETLACQWLTVPVERTNSRQLIGAVLLENLRYVFIPINLLFFFRMSTFASGKKNDPYSGTTRSLTEVFMLLRSNAHQSRLLYQDDRDIVVRSRGEEERMALVELEEGRDDPEEGEELVWIATADEVDFEFDRARQRLDDLKEAQRKHISRPNFGDETFEKEEKEMEITTEQITQMLVHSQRLIKMIGTSRGNEKPMQRKIRENAATTLSLTLSQITDEFRERQLKYLSDIQNRSRNVDNFLITTDSLFDAPNWEDFEASPSAELSMDQLQQFINSDREVREREKEVLAVNTSIRELNNIFKDLSQIIVDQGSIIDSFQNRL
uniref:t-SNARE coiled-coil homology domain-containing protein n=1 Tax=Caenorhabditis japonica TaxID=281687 RepID=A0A8R1DG08_CAEJA